MGKTPPADQQPENRSPLAGERRREPRLPEELVAVMTDNAAAARMIDSLPAETRADTARYVAEPRDRTTRARRAVEVVRTEVARQQEAAAGPD